MTADLLVRCWSWAGRAGVAGADSQLAQRFQHVGHGTAFAFPPGPAMGERWIRIGADTLIGPGVVLSAGMWPGEPFVPPAGWALRIGDRCNLGRGMAVVGRAGIDIGDDVTFGPSVYVTDHNHAYTEPDVPISRQWVVEDPVSIGAGSWIGAGAMILPGARLGRHVAVAAHSVVRGVVPDRCVVAGAPAVVVRRWDSATGRWEPPRRGRSDEAASGPPAGWYDEVARRSPG